MGQVPGFLGLPQLVLHLGQRVPQRLNQVLDRGPAGLQLARGLGVGGAERPSAISRNIVALRSSACADMAWKRSASWPSISAARSWAARSMMAARSCADRARSSAARACPVRSAVMLASRPRAYR